MSEDRIVRIYRGLPGSGKNTHAEADDFLVVSADDYHTDKEGRYNYRPELADEAHLTCFKKFVSAISTDKPKVAVCNTNVTRAQYTPYVMMARALNYDVRLMHMKCSVATAIQRNVHDVPPEQIGRMAALWENPASYDPTQLVINTDEE